MKTRSQSLQELFEKPIEGHPSNNEREEIIRLRTAILFLSDELQQAENRIRRLEQQTSPRMIKMK